jgi:hypothetical protein
LASPELGAHFEYFVRVLAPQTQVEANGKTFGLTDTFDVHFAGRYGALVQWLRFSFEVNLSSFFDGTPELAALFSK